MSARSTGPTTASAIPPQVAIGGRVAAVVAIGPNPTPFLTDLTISRASRGDKEGAEVLYWLGKDKACAQRLADLLPTRPLRDALVHAPSDYLSVRRQALRGPRDPRARIEVQRWVNTPMTHIQTRVRMGHNTSAG